MQKNFSELLDKITSWCAFTMILLLIFAIANFMMMMVFGEIVMKSDHPILIALVQFGAVAAFLWFIGGRIYGKVVQPQAEMPIPAFTSRFLGVLRGLMLAGVVALAVGLVVIFVEPRLYFHQKASKAVMIWLVLGAVWGFLNPPLKVARLTRLFVFLALVCQFFVFQLLFTASRILPLTFDYSVPEYRTDADFPLIDSQILKGTLPDNAKNIKYYGFRGVFAVFSWSCDCDQASFQRFCAANNYKFDGDVKACKPEYFGLKTLPAKFRCHGDFTRDGVGYIMMYDEVDGKLYGCMPPR